MKKRHREGQEIGEGEKEMKKEREKGTSCVVQNVVVNPWSLVV